MMFDLTSESDNHVQKYDIYARVRVRVRVRVHVRVHVE